MNEGDVIITRMPQADGKTKPRPAILLRQMPPFGDLLTCGVSSKLQWQVVGFDELIEPLHDDFKSSGLKASSLIRLGYLALASESEILGVIGSISAERHERLLEQLSKLLAPKKLP